MSNLLFVFKKVYYTEVYYTIFLTTDTTFSRRDGHYKIGVYIKSNI